MVPNAKSGGAELVAALPVLRCDRWSPGSLVLARMTPAELVQPRAGLPDCGGTSGIPPGGCSAVEKWSSARLASG